MEKAENVVEQMMKLKSKLMEAENVVKQIDKIKVQANEAENVVKQINEIEDQAKNVVEQIGELKSKLQAENVVRQIDEICALFGRIHADAGAGEGEPKEEKKEIKFLINRIVFLKEI